MPLDITLFRKDGGNPDLIRESQRRRYKPVEAVDEIIAKDDEWRLLTGSIDKLRKQRNIIQKDIANIKKAVAIAAKEGKSAEEQAQLDQQSVELVKQKDALDIEIEQSELKQKDLKVEVDKMLTKIGNIVADNVPVSLDEAENRVERRWGTPRDPKGLLNHHDVLWRIGGYEPDRGAAVAGHRGYFLRDVGVMLNQAFINYGIAFLRKRGYVVLQPPFMMKKEVMAGVAQLEQFDEELYKVTGDGEDKYLIATSEQPICALHMSEWLEEKQLPMFYAGTSTCFRKEAGSHGKDTWGIFRVHQFEKVEQFAIVEGDLEKSNAVQEEMIRTAEEFYQSLGFPYQVINIVSGALNNAAIRKYDLEAWFPGYNNYRELVSCSNCTDYQSRAMEIRCGIKKMGDREKKYVHMLNATLCATGRAICCLLENYQEADGVRVPEVLVPFMGGLTFLPFVRDAKGTTADSASKKEDKKEKKEEKKKDEKKPVPAPAPVAAAPVVPPAAPVEAPAAAAAAAAPRSAPTYTTPAPADSTQRLLYPLHHTSHMTAYTVPSAEQVVTLSAAGEISQVHFEALSDRLKFYSYVSGDVAAELDNRVFVFLQAAEPETRAQAEAHPSIARYLRHMAVFSKSPAYPF
eukprot:scaffold4140_cov178-Ochromonas_danica.AAC.16